VFLNAIDSLSEDDRKLPQISAILPLLKRGIGIHHGGLLPILKEVRSRTRRLNHQQQSARLPQRNFDNDRTRLALLWSHLISPPPRPTASPRR